MAGELELRDVPDGPQVLLNGRTLYGSPPLPSARRRVESLTIEPGTIVLWASPLLWHGLEALLEKLPADCLILAVEANQRLLELARHTLGSRARAALLSICPANRDEILSTYRIHTQARFRRVLELTTSASARDHRQTYAGLAHDLRRDLERFWRNRITLASLGRLWLSNIASNLPSLAKSHAITSLAGPTVVCGAGPSLDRVMPTLARVRDRVHIVAVDTALRALEANGITPDLVIALDGQIANLYDFLGTSPGTIVSDLSAHPDTHFQAPRVVPTLTSFAPFGLLTRIASATPATMSLPPLGSVGIAAVHLAKRLGAGPMFLAGLDFAVQPGTTHSRSSTPTHRGHLHSTRLRPAHDPAIGGRVIRREVPEGSVLTTPVLVGYADALSDELETSTDVYVVSRIGLPLGVPEIAPDELDSLIGRESLDDLRVTPTGRPGTADIADFLESEVALLEKADPSDATSLAPVDYLYSLVPDAIVTLTDQVVVDANRIVSDRPLQARIAAARSYMLDRWKVALARVRPTASTD